MRILIVGVVPPDLKEEESALKEKYYPPQFHPHITLANKLLPDRYQKIISELTNYHPQFNYILEKISLFQFDFNKHIWQFIRNFPLED